MQMAVHGHCMNTVGLTHGKQAAYGVELHPRAQAIGMIDSIVSVIFFFPVEHSKFDLRVSVAKRRHKYPNDIWKKNLEHFQIVLDCSFIYQNMLPSNFIYKAQTNEPIQSVEKVLIQADKKRAYERVASVLPTQHQE